MTVEINHADRAEALFRQGYNCAQAVFCAFADEVGLSVPMAARIASSFGGGIGRLREVCGAVSGMMLVCGYLRGYDDVEHPEAKSEHYAFVRSLAEEFRREAGSIVCREIMPGASVGGEPEKRTEAFYQKRPCLRMVRLAARITEERVLTHGVH